MSKGSVIIVSGPSGTGKGTIVGKIMEQRKDLFLSISCTTRAPREGEVPGKNYYYISREEFEKRKKENFFLEYAEYVNNCYGTPMAPVLEAIEKGLSTVLEIEVNGALEAKKRYPDAVMIFVLPPSVSELRRRLETRDAGNPVALAAIDGRIAKAMEEMEHIGEYDYVVVNDELEKAVNLTNAIITAATAEVKNNKEEIEKVKNS